MRMGGEQCEMEEREILWQGSGRVIGGEEYAEGRGGVKKGVSILQAYAPLA